MFWLLCDWYVFKNCCIDQEFEMEDSCNHKYHHKECNTLERTLKYSSGVWDIISIIFLNNIFEHTSVS